MKIAFFGTGVFGIPTLRALAGSVCLVVTQPDRPSGRGLRLAASPVRLAAEELGLPCASPEKARSPEFVEALRATGADFLFVASYGQILSQAVLDSAPRGGINLHGSILPKYRGAAPIQRCIMDGQKETGVTLMQMDKGMDTGDMIDVSRIPIGPDDTYGELQDRLALVARDLAVRWAPRIAAGDYPRRGQDDAEATLAPKLQKAEGELQVLGEAKSEYDRFRAFTPSPGAFLRTDLGQLRISSARLRSESGEPGTVIAAKPGLVVAFGAGSLELLEVQPEGKKRMTGKDFANGARLVPGARLA